MVLEFVLHAIDVVHLFQEEAVNLGQEIDVIDHDSLSEGFHDGKGSFVRMLLDDVDELFHGFVLELAKFEMAGLDLKGTDGLEHAFFDGSSDGHDFAGRLHLCRQRTVGIIELVKRETGNLGDDIVKGRLEACLGVGDVDFIKLHADGNLGRDPGNRETGCLAGQGRGTADTWVDLDDVVLEGIGIEGELDIASTFDL